MLVQEFKGYSIQECWYIIVQLQYIRSVDTKYLSSNSSWSEDVNQFSITVCRTIKPLLNRYSVFLIAFASPCTHFTSSSSAAGQFQYSRTQAPKTTWNYQDVFLILRMHRGCRLVHNESSLKFQKSILQQNNSVLQKPDP